MPPCICPTALLARTNCQSTPATRGDEPFTVPPVEQKPSPKAFLTVLSYLYHTLWTIYYTLARAVLGIAKILLWLARTLFWLVIQIGRGFIAIARPALRFLAFVLLIVAAIALVADLTPYIDHGRNFTFTSVTTHWQTISPTSLQGAQTSITLTAGEWAWNALSVLVLNFPTFFVFGMFGCLAAYLGRRQSTLNVYAN